MLRAGLRLLSLRNRVVRAKRSLSVSARAQSPAARRAKQRRRPVQLPNTLQAAIEFRQEVSFYYTDSDGSPTGLRRGHPHAVWIEDGVKYLHMWVLPGSISEGRLPGWRTFKVGRIRQLSVLENPLMIGDNPAPFRFAPGWNPSYYRRAGTPVYIAK